MRLLRIGDVCAVTQLSQAMVSKLIRDGEIPVIHFGRATRIPEDALNEYLEAKQAEAAAERGATKVVQFRQELRG